MYFFQFLGGAKAEHCKRSTQEQRMEAARSTAESLVLAEGISMVPTQNKSNLYF